jgi:hypothetical protein
MDSVFVGTDCSVGQIHTETLNTSTLDHVVTGLRFSVKCRVYSHGYSK